jgi:hypothetical protein
MADPLVCYCSIFVSTSHQDTLLDTAFLIQKILPSSLLSICIQSTTRLAVKLLGDGDTAQRHWHMVF